MTQGSFFLADFGAGERARAKALLEADDSDACRRRYLLGGVVMALFVLPHLQRLGKPHVVVPSLEALSRLFEESLGDFDVGGRSDVRSLERNVLRRRSILDDTFHRLGQVLQSTC
jgi:hypothetical protein